MAKQSLQFKQKQQLRITPQLQQAIRLLQMNAQQLMREVQSVIEENPLLEVQTHNQTQNGENSSEMTLPSSKTNSTEKAPPAAQSSVASNNWAYNSSESSIDAWDLQENRYEHCLKQHLAQQLANCRLSATDKIISYVILDAIDEQGFLAETIDSITATCRQHLEIDKSEVEANLHRIWHLEPQGIASENLQQYLLFQLQQLSANDKLSGALAAKNPQQNQPQQKELQLASTIISQHLDLLGRRDYARLQQQLKISADELATAVAIIQSLNPRPAAQFTLEPTQYITPDVYVHKHHQRWQVSLNPSLELDLRINPEYAKLGATTSSKSTKAYIKQNSQAASFFINSLNSRNQTILKTAEAIVAHQRTFFDYGAAGMRCLTLEEIAAEIGMHESTISRATTDKYMHTPQGIFEFKYFFSSQVATSDGGACSAISIRDSIKQLIDNEPPQKPLSDSKICSILQQDGIKIARRTVAKYREEMHIPATYLRKSL